MEVPFEEGVPTRGAPPWRGEMQSLGPGPSQRTYTREQKRPTEAIQLAGRVTSERLRLQTAHTKTEIDG